MLKFNKTFKSVVFILTAILLNGCDTFGSYDYYVDNKSDSTLTVYYGWLNKSETKTIPPHSALVIDTLSTNNGLTDLGDRFIKEYFDSMSVHVNGILIKKDINSRTNWEYAQDDENYKNIYTLIINNSDVQ